MEKNLTYLYINTIIEERSLSVAADKLGISQPALSSFLKKLENELGDRIFDRSKKPLQITAAGEVFKEYLEKSAIIEKEMIRKIADLKDLVTGRLSIGGAVFFNVSYIPAAIAKFHKLHPGVDIEIIDGKIPQLMTAAQNGKIDLLITPGPKEEERFCFEEFLEEKVFLCVPPEWAINKELNAQAVPGEVIVSGRNYENEYKKLTKDDMRKLENSTFIMLSQEQDIGRKLRNIIIDNDILPTKEISAEQTMTSLALAMAGVGVCLITENSIKHGNMKKFPKIYMIDDEDAGSRKMYAAYDKKRILSHAATEFIRILKEEYKERV